ncbi:MAG: ABC transporter ATP-binding protein [Lachnospiraceae bacterium]
MIKAINIGKTYGDYAALKTVNMEMKEGQVFGLIGTNGAGKSSLLRIMCGINPADEGSLLVDEEEVYDNISAKNKLCFVSDNPYFLSGSTPRTMAAFYRLVYSGFAMEEFEHYLEQFGLDGNRSVSKFSKGMKKQLALLLGLCTKTKYLLLDETFDGLDPVMRQAAKSLIAKEMEERNLTPVIASHNLRELEDICDTIGLLHKGGVLLSKDLDEAKCSMQKVQCVFADETDAQQVRENLEVIKEERRGSLFVFTIRGNRAKTHAAFDCLHTVFCEMLPLSLEEIFISETEVVGYDIKKIILE